MKRILTSLLTVLLVFALAGCGNTGESSAPSESDRAPNQTAGTPTDSTLPEAAPPEEFVLVSGGTFQMGSPESEPWRSEDETVHTVTLSDFYISRYEVTQAEYQAVMGENPSSFTGDDLPVDSVSWPDAVTYCNARSKSEGLTPAYTVAGVSFEPNALGLYNIHGNVGEWVWDWYGPYETGEQADPASGTRGRRAVRAEPDSDHKAGA